MTTINIKMNNININLSFSINIHYISSSIPIWFISVRPGWMIIAHISLADFEVQKSLIDPKTFWSDTCVNKKICKLCHMDECEGNRNECMETESQSGGMW